MGDILKLGIVLFIVAMAAGFAIALTNNYTKDKIAEQEFLAQQEALKTVFGDGIAIEEKEPSQSIPFTYWIGRKNDSIVGYSFECASRGYSGDIRFIVGVDENGTILGLTVLSQQETPGLGDRVEEVVSKKYLWNGLFAKKDFDTPWFTKQFKGLKADDKIGIDKSAEWHTLSPEQRQALKTKNTVTAITGATISTRAVTNALAKQASENLSLIVKE